MLRKLRNQGPVPRWVSGEQSTSIDFSLMLTWVQVPVSYLACDFQNIFYLPLNFLTVRVILIIIAILPRVGVSIE